MNYPVMALLTVPAWVALGAFWLWLSDPEPSKTLSRVLSVSVTAVFAECALIALVAALRLG